MATVRDPAPFPEVTVTPGAPVTVQLVSASLTPMVSGVVPVSVMAGENFNPPDTPVHEIDALVTSTLAATEPATPAVAATRPTGMATAAQVTSSFFMFPPTLLDIEGPLPSMDETIVRYEQSLLWEMKNLIITT